MKNKLSLLLIIIFALSVVSAEIPALDQWNKFSHTPASRELLVWLKKCAFRSLNGETADPAFQFELPELSGRAGMFITLVRRGKVRGCYGAFDHEPASTKEIFLQYLRGALYLDPRYRPIESAELEDTEIIVTLTSYPEPVDDPNNIDIALFGMFIECDDQPGRVIVPAEFRTLSRVTALAEKNDCRYSKFRAVTIR
ncbi:MAG TPA: AMMECR1 domain-containing protein [Spirochaetota bacterium]|nr:AMMECR1 domain-containing protein [Spirochaetota bacterium]